MTLQVNATSTIGDFSLGVDLAAGRGEVVAVMGPNGAGKSSLVELICGLRSVDSGSVRLGEEAWDAPAEGQWVPTHRRRLGVVFQQPRLLPSLTAVANIEFGLRSLGVDPKSAGTKAGEWLERVGMAERSASRPSTLSGGEAQRVALARALALDPSVLLVDEPLAAVDVQGRAVLRRVLAQHLRSSDRPGVIVTHDLVDALALADRIVVMERGRVVQDGRPDQLRAAPSSAFVADLFGVNILFGRAERGEVTVDGLADPLRIVDSELRGDVVVSLAPSAVALHGAPPSGSPRNSWRSEVAGIELLGEVRRVRLEGGVTLMADVTAGAVSELGLVPGSSVWVAIKATELEVRSQ